MVLFRPHKNHQDAIPLLVVVIILVIILIVITLYLRRRRGQHRKRQSKRCVIRNDTRRQPERSSNQEDNRWDGQWKTLFDDEDDRFSRHLTAAEFLGDEAAQLDELRAWIGKGSGELSKPYFIKAPRYPVESGSTFTSSSGHSSSTRTSSTSSSTSPVCPSEQPQNCPKCKDGGLDAHCSVDTDCACGLKCQGRRCVCPKPPPPTLHIQRNGTSITVTFSPVPGADYYNIFLFDANGVAHAIQLFTNQTVITFPDLPPGSYHVFAFSGSNQCGSLQQFSQSDIITILSCKTNTDCPNITAPHCLAGTCVQCLVSTDCPNGQICNLTTHTCNPACNLSTDCITADTVCINQQCVCPTPVITGIIISNVTSPAWPGPIQVTFQGTGFSSAGADFSFTWRGVGSTGTVVASGSVTSNFLPLNHYPAIPTPFFPSNTMCAGFAFPCCNSDNFGCASAGCVSNPAPNVVLEFINVQVSNACGNTSVPTCWRFTSLCPGGPAQAVQFTCPPQ